MRLFQTHHAQKVRETTQPSSGASLDTTLRIKHGGREMDSRRQSDQVLAGETVWRDQMRQMERGNEADAQPDVARACRQIIVPARY